MIEGIVRPFQSPQVTQSGQIPVPSVGPVRPASLKWGGVGKVPPFRLSWHLQDNFDEKSRNTDNVRIFNPQDNTQYVDVQRTNSLKMGKTGGPGAVLYSPFTADIASAFDEFDADVQSAFTGFSPTFDDQGTTQNPDQAQFTFHPKA